MTALQLLKASYRLLVGEDDPSTEVLDNGLLALNAILSEWGTTPWGTYTTQQETHTLTAGTASYTIGSGGTINTTRPTEILGAFVRSGTTDYPLRILSVGDYRKFPEKTTQGTPSGIYYATAYPLATIYLYPVPSATMTLYFDSRKALSAYASTAVSLALPPEYETALKYATAIDWAPELSVTVSQEVVARANETKKNLRRLRSQPVQGIRTAPFGFLDSYDITTDTHT